MRARQVCGNAFSQKLSVPVTQICFFLRERSSLNFNLHGNAGTHLISGVNEKQTTPAETAAPAPKTTRAPLRMQPLAADSFTTFVYACIWVLLIGEFVALFWLDLF